MDGTPPDLAAPDRSDTIKPTRISLRAALTGVTLLIVVLTAGLTHFAWSTIARQNVEDVVDQLNLEIVGTVKHELNGVLDNVLAAQESLRSIFFQNVIDTKDERNREFIFLAALRSQPSLSWVSFGWPNGNFFGAQKASDLDINMVEVIWDPVSNTGQRRVDYYKAEAGDIIFQEREFKETDFNSTAQNWYQESVKAETPVWTIQSNFPLLPHPAVGTSTKLYVYGEYIGVINVVVELERLSKFLASVKVGKTGTVFILDEEGTVVASPNPADIERQRSGSFMTLRNLTDQDNAMLAVTRDALAQEKIGLSDIKSVQQFTTQAANGETYFVTFSPLGFRNWVVATVIPESDFLAEIERKTQLLGYGLIGFTLVIAGLAVFLTNRLIIRPLTRIAGQLSYIETFRLDRIMRLPSFLRELDDLSAALIQMGRGLASFQKYLPTELVRTLVSQGVEAKPGGSRQILTVFFTDLQGFTSLSEKLRDRVVPVLTEYLSLTSRIVVSEKGTIDKFIGDAVMAFWGAPIANERHAESACRAALACQRALKAEAIAVDETGTMLAMRIGINTGPMLVGNIGSDDRLSYTVIGDTVNVAARLEPVNKRYGTDIIIGEDTRKAVGDKVIVRLLDRVAVYGRQQGIAIYELLGMAEDRADLGDLTWVSEYETGFSFYLQRDWQRATEYFTRADALRGGDMASQVLKARCAEYEVEPPDSGWDGVVSLDSK